MSGAASGSKKDRLSFEEMIGALHEVFSKDAVEIERVEEIMASYRSNKADWAKFALLDAHRYTRNLIDDGNGKFNLMLLAWNNGQASSIHNHAGAHCFMKILGGGLEQELYDPQEATDQPEVIEEMIPAAVSNHTTDSVLYISDTIGLHRVSNKSHVEPAFSLHLYSPPYRTCHVFDKRSGRAIMCPNLTFYSNNGVKIDPLDRAM